MADRCVPDSKEHKGFMCTKGFVNDCVVNAFQWRDKGEALFVCS